MKQKTGRKLLSFLLTLAMVVGLVPGMGLTVYAAGGTEVTQANVICQQYSYMDADYYSGGVLNDTPPAEITNITLADAQAFGAAVNCPTTYWIVVYAKDGDNLKWTSNGKTGEQTSTPRSGLSAWCNLINDDVFHFGGNYDPFRDVTFYFSKGLATVFVTGVSLDKTTAQTIEVDGKVSFTASIEPSDATNKKVKWSTTGGVTLYSDENCTAGNEIGADATSTLTVYAKGMSAGSATVTVTATNGTDDTADDKSASCNVTVNPVTYEVTYQVVNGTWSDGSKADKKETVQSGAKPASVPIGMKASSGYTGGAWYTDPASATITGAKTFIFTFTAKQAATVTKVPVAKPLTYTGSSQELVTAGTASGGTMQYAIGTKDAATQTYTTSIPTKTDAGTYYVWYKVVGDDNHNDYGPYPVTVSILNAKVEPKAPTGNKLVYNGKEQQLVKAGSVEGGTSTLLYALGADGKTAPADGDFKETVPSAKDAGTYYVWYKVQGDKNHNGTDPMALEVEIAKKALVVSAEDKSKTYGDADPKLTWTQKGLVEGDPLTVTLKRDAGENVGGHIITFDKYEASDNYEKGFNEAALTIVAREATVTAVDQTITEGEAIKTDVSMATLSGQAKGDTLSAITLTANAVNAAEATTGAITASGAKIVNAAGEDVTGNYSLTYTSGKLTVNPKPTEKPTETPTEKPTEAPTAKPTEKPTEAPTEKPTEAPTEKPTEAPTAKPTAKPTEAPKPEPKPVVPDVALLARMTVSGSSKTAFKVAWTKVPGADGYDVYFAKCGREYKSKPKASVKGCSVKVTKLTERTEYKAYVRAWMKVNGKKVYLGDSPEIHAITGGYDAKRCNAQSVKLNKGSVTLKVGKSTTVKATVKGVKSGKKVLQHVRKVRYYSSNVNVAIVNKNGKIKATGTGKCTIYAIANNGVRTSVKVTVK